MNQEDVIRMAREVGIDAEKDTLCRNEGWVEPLEQFAALVAKHTLANIDPSSFMSWQEGYAAGAAAERKVIMDSLQKQADLAVDDLDRRWALEMKAAVAARSKP